MRVLVGNTGLIGKTLLEQQAFDLEFNSSNIHQFNQLVSGGATLYLSCLPATKWQVNNNIMSDLQNIYSIIEHIKNTSFDKIYLFSTIDVYANTSLEANESILPTITQINYGSNRYIFELLVQQILQFNSIRIIRLPALFGKFLRKNILFDLLNNHNLDRINRNSQYQWYDLSDLSSDLAEIDQRNLTLCNLFTEPLHTDDIINRFFSKQASVGFYSTQPIIYNYHTQYSNSSYPYWRNKDYVYSALGKFLDEARS